MLLPCIVEDARQDGYDDMTGRHNESSGNENRFPASVVDPNDRGYCREEHDYTNYTGSQKRYSVSGEAERAEDWWCIVKDGVDTSPLLEEHGEGADSSPE